MPKSSIGDPNKYGIKRVRKPMKQVAAESTTIGALRQKALKEAKSKGVKSNVQLPAPKTQKLKSKFEWDPEKYKKGQQK